MKNSDKPTCGDHGGHTKSGDPCAYVEGWGTDFDSGKCKKHRGTSPDGESHAGNQHAMESGLHSDPVDLFNYLAENEPDALEYIFFKLREYAKDSVKPVFEVDVQDAETFDEAQSNLTGHGGELLRMCVQDYARWRATKRQLTEGMITEQTRSGEHGTYTVQDSNPINLDLDRAERTKLKQLKEHGLSSSPEQKQADATETLIEVLKED